MKTYKELKDFVIRHHLVHECYPVKNSYEKLQQEDGKIQRIRCETIRGWLFGVHNIEGKKGTGQDEWIWFKCMNPVRELSDNSVFFFEQRYSETKNKAFRGTRERLAAYAAIQRREQWNKKTTLKQK